MFTESRAIYLILISAVLWSVQPAFILLVGVEYANAAALFIGLTELIGSILAGVFAWRLTPRDFLRRFFAERRRTVRFLAVTILDGIFVSVSYTALIFSARTSSLSEAAVLFESWPIFVSALLFFVLPKKDDSFTGAGLGILLLVAGFSVLNFNGIEALMQDGFDWLDGLPLLSAVSMALAVSIIQVLIAADKELGEWQNFFFVMAVRNGFAFLFMFLIFWWSGETLSEGGRDLSFMALSLTVGAFFFLSSVFFHMGYKLASTNATGLVALLSPVLGPIFLFVLGYASPTVGFLMGAAFILGGLAVSTRADDNTANYKIVLISTLAIGAVIVIFDGSPAENYFNYLNALALFYGIIQANILNQLVRRHDEVLALHSELFVQFSLRRDPEHRARTRAEIERVRDIRRRSSSLSEILLMTVIFFAISAVIVFERENTLLGDFVAFTISVTSLYLLGISWRYFTDIVTSPARLGRHRRRGSSLRFRLFSHVTLIVLFLWLYLTIYATYVL